MSNPPLPKPKNARNRPERSADAPQEPDRELESYLAAISPESEVEVTDTGRRFNNAQVYQLRLPLSANEQLRWLAQERGTSPLSLAQEWVLQRLAWETRQNPQSGPQAPGPQAPPPPAGPATPGGGPGSPYSSEVTSPQPPSALNQQQPYQSPGGYSNYR